MSDIHELSAGPPRISSQHDSHSRLGRAAKFCIALFALFTFPGYASDWESVDNTSDGIQVFKREAGDSGLVAFRGVGYVEAPLALVATVILDTSRRPEWIDGLADSKIIRWESKDNFVEYDHIGLPFFVKDRDFVTKIKINFDPFRKELIFHYRASNDPSAPRTHYIRGDLIEATFILHSADDKKTRVDAEFLCDPKGLIPKWLVNFFLSDWPKTTFRSLRKEVLKSGIAIDPRLSKLLTHGIDDHKDR